MEPKYKQLCLKELKRTDRDKRAAFVSPYWTEKLIRPVIGGHQAVLACEIYSEPQNPDEHQTIRSLNALISEGLVEIIWRTSTPWYLLK